MRAPVAFCAVYLALVQLCAGNYVAAIAQHTAVSAATPTATLQANLLIYQNMTTIAKRNGAQMIIFPEFGLGGQLISRATAYAFTEQIPNILAGNYSTPCNTPSQFGDRPVTLGASCMAARNKIVVVINMYDRQPCQVGTDSCKDGHFQYNTEVVFNESGTIIAKYHKMHPWFTEAFDTPPANLVTFTTSFGVKFGLMVCFDIAFPSPGPTLAKSGIKHFPYSASESNVGKAIFKSWSLMYSVTVIGANLGLDGSGAYTTGTLLASKTFPLGDSTGRSVMITTVNA